jgi:hypothetical protein
MSGPIVRKYGFPNFDKIFGKKELEHGVEETPPAEQPKAQPAPEPKPAEAPKSE